MTTVGARTRIVMSIYFLLTVLMWGLFALDRGPWQDEVSALQNVQAHSDSRLAQLFTGMPTTTRVLGGTVFTIGHWTGAPVLVLQCVYGFALFATGWLVHLLVRELFPERPWLAYVAGAMALAASGDFTLNYLGTTSLTLSVCAYLAALVFLIRYSHGAHGFTAAASCTLLVLGLGMYEGTLPAILLTPLLLVALQRFRPKRTIAAAALWYGMTALYLCFLASEFWRGGGYMAVAFRPMSLADRWDRTWMLFWNNFTPWTWASGRHNWFPAPPPLLPLPIRLAPTFLAVAAFWLAAVRIWRRWPESPRFTPEERYRTVVAGIGAPVMVLASNAAYASVQFSEYFFRTQLVSSRWASLTVALVSYVVGVIRLRSPLLALIVPATFVGFGVYGGLERQDYFLGYWRWHREELRSIVEQVRPLRAESRVLLYVPARSPYLATEATYLARSWLSYLYDDPSLARRVFLWSPDRGTSCAAGEEAFRCLGESRDGAPAEESILPYRSMVLLTFRPRENRYALERSVPRGLLDSRQTPPDYRPERQFTAGDVPDYARRLLSRREYLAALLPAVRAAPEAAARPVLQEPIEMPATGHRVEWGPVRAACTMKAGSKQPVAVVVRNAGDQFWSSLSSTRTGRGAVRLGYRWWSPKDPRRPVTDYGEERGDLRQTLGPGGSVTMTVMVATPSTPGSYQLQLDLVEELVSWFEGRGAAKLMVPVTVD
jgi:hypothetical protein